MNPFRWRKMTWVLALFTVAVAILNVAITRATIRCPACGTEARTGQTVCKKCGNNLTMGVPTPGSPNVRSPRLPRLLPGSGY
jgi:predicted amidophosphoribosyltransferase